MTMSDERAAEVAADEPTDPGAEIGYSDTVKADEPDVWGTVQGLLFHPHLVPNVKVLLLQLAWLDRDLTADDLSKGTTLTPLQVQYALKESIDLGLVTTMKKPFDEVEKYLRVYRAARDLGHLLSTVPERQAPVQTGADDQKADE